jgi:hypothetical protein
MASYRSRHASGLDAILIDIERQLVLPSGLMSASDYDNPVERRGTSRASTSGPRDRPRIHYWSPGLERVGGWRNGLVGQSLPAINAVSGWGCLPHKGRGGHRCPLTAERGGVEIDVCFVPRADMRHPMPDYPAHSRVIADDAMSYDLHMGHGTSMDPRVMARDMRNRSVIA